MQSRKRADFWEQAAFPLLGRIGTVFRKAADVSCDGFLLTLMTDEAYLHPLSVLVEKNLFAGLEPGMPVVVDASGIRIGMSRLAWGEDIPGIRRPGQPFSAVNAGMGAAKLRKLLGIAGSRSKVGEAFLDDRSSSEFLEPVEALRHELFTGSADLAVVERWFGGGAGLTPAWDDFCTGVLLCDRFYGTSRVAPAGDLLARLAGKTTIQSLWQLRFAEAGHSALLIERFLEGLAAGGVRAADVMRVAGVGHTSGSDILCGICLWLEAFAAASGGMIRTGGREIGIMRFQPHT